MKITKRVSTTYVSDDGFSFQHEPIDDTVTITTTPSGYEARYLVVDQDPTSPDEDADKNAFLVHYHRDFDIRHDAWITQDEIAKWYREEPNTIEATYWCVPVAAYIHGQVVLSLGAGSHFPDPQWDVSHCGAVLMSKAEWPEEAKARDYAKGIIENWNAYLSGDVYAIVKETYTKDKEPIEDGYDACWGYVGFDDAMQSLKSEI